MDVEGHMLMHVPFSEVLRPRGAPKTPSVHRGHQAIVARHRELVRSQAELRAEFEKTQSALETIRTTLASLPDPAPPQDPR
jgi:hypothetical protein